MSTGSSSSSGSSSSGGSKGSPTGSAGSKGSGGSFGSSGSSVGSSGWSTSESGPGEPSDGSASSGSGSVSGGSQASRSSASQQSSSSSGSTADWKAWPGGQTDHSLNPVAIFRSTDFGFNGNVNWSVGGPGPPVISETGTQTATNLDKITVRYDRPRKAQASGCAWIKAQSGGMTKTKSRTIFKVTWSVKIDGNLNADNNLPFGSGSGFDFYSGPGRRRICEFNWDGERGATRIAAKMEATCEFLPHGIDWNERGVTFRYDGEQGTIFSFRIRQYKRSSSVDEGTMFPPYPYRQVGTNDNGWVNDVSKIPPHVSSDAGNTQYPTTAKPNQAFYIDAPGRSRDPGDKQFAYRGDFSDLAQWYDGSEWQNISVWTEAAWHVNYTAVSQTPPKETTTATVRPCRPRKSRTINLSLAQGLTRL